MSAPIALLAPRVKVNGRELSAAQLESLVSLRIELGQCVVGRATLRFTDAGFAISAANTFALGAEVEVSVPRQGKLFSGTVTGVTLDQSMASAPELVAVVDDAGYRFGRSAKPTTYLQSSYAQVLEKLAKEAGLSTDGLARSSPLSETYEYLLQTGTPLAMIDHIARRTGSVWRVQDKDLVFEPAGTAHGSVSAELGRELITFSVRASALRPTAVKVSGWDAKQQAPIVGTATPTSDSPPLFVSAYTGARPQAELAEASVSLGELLPTTANDAQALATALAEADAEGAVVARGTCHITPGLKPGVQLQVSGAGPASGNYLTSEVEHVYSVRGFHTKFVAGPHRPTTLVDTLGRAAPDPGLRIPGLVIGIVTDSKDPDNTGRVKVKFPGLTDDVQSDWARVVSLGAGNNRGAVFQPEVDDEVLVGFEFGDTRRAVVIGGLYSPKNTLPEANKVVGDGGAIGYRRITSRKNHIVEFADGEQPAEQHILLKLGTAEHKLRLGADALAIEVASGKPVTITAGSSKFEITDSGDVKIEGTNVSIKATGQLTLEGNQAALKAQTQGQLQAMTLDVKAQANASIDGGGALTLKGGMVQIN